MAKVAATVLVTAAVAAALLLLVATTVWTPVSNDAGTYLTIADGILSGKLPYRDLFDHKTPGIYYTFAAALAASGRSLAAVQALQALAAAAMAAALGWLARRLWDVSSGIVSALLALYGGAAYQGGHLTTEAWVALATALLCVVLLRRPADTLTTRHWLAAGVLAGVATLYKQSGVLALIAVMVWAAGLRGSAPARRQRLVACAAGYALPLAATALWFTAHGTLADLWRDAVVVNAVHYPRSAWSVLMRGNWINLRAFPLLWVGVVVAAGVAWRRRSAELGLLWLLLLAGLLPLSHRAYGHYVLQALPPAALLAAWGLMQTWQRLHSRPRWLRAALAVLVMALALIDLPAWPRYLAYTRQLAVQQDEVAAVVQRLSRPDQPVLAVSAAAQLYFLSERSPASRWLYWYPVNTTPTRVDEMAALITRRAATVVVIDDREPQPATETLAAAAQATCTRWPQPLPAPWRLYTCFPLP